MNPTDRRWFEYRRLVTFADTNVAGSVYYANYFAWQGECREQLLAQSYPEFADDLRRGFSLVTEFAQQEFFQEASLFDWVVVRQTVTALTRSRIEFEFEFVREKDGVLLSRGRQAVLWMNQQRRPSLMPEKLYAATAGYFGLPLET